MKRDQRIYHPVVSQSQLPPQICYAIVLKILQNLKKKKGKLNSKSDLSKKQNLNIHACQCLTQMIYGTCNQIWSAKGDFTRK